jgi:transcriptional regulator with XRE-family HTH domain
VIGSRMRELREAAGVPLTRAATLSGWDKGHLSRVERGHTKPSRELIEWYDASFGAGCRRTIIPTTGLNLSAKPCRTDTGMPRRVLREDLAATYATAASGRGATDG